MTGPGSSEGWPWRGPATGAVLAGLLLANPAAGENIDPLQDQQQYAWAENGGWVNFEPSGDGGPGVEVHDFELTGWAWAENLGWINLSCSNQRTCDRVDWGVVNDGRGNLSGTAWAENGGWVNFRPAAVSDAGVRIDVTTGVFHGDAWTENGGWIRFGFADPQLQLFQVTTSWNCNPAPPVPGGSPTVTFSGADGFHLTWTSVAGSTGSDVVQGELNALRSSGGDFAQTNAECLANNETGTSLEVPKLPPSGDGYWLLVRPANCGGAGSFDSLASGQVGSRDDRLGGGTVCASP